MALLTLAQLVNDVDDEIPGKGLAQIVRAANKVIRRIYSEMVEPKRSTFTTKAAVSTGTVSVTKGSTTATFSSGVVLAADPPLRLVLISGETAWFTLTRGAGNTDGVLSSAWAAPDNATATFQIIYPLVVFPSEVGEVISIWRDGFEPLKFALDERGAIIPRQMTLGIPSRWSPYARDESAASPNDDKLSILLSPVAENPAIFTYSYRVRRTFLDPAGADTQTIPLGDLWYDAIVQGCLFYLWKQESAKEKALMQYPIYEKVLGLARGAALPAAVVPPRGRRGGLYVYEQRPIGGN